MVCPVFFDFQTVIISEGMRKRENTERIRQFPQKSRLVFILSQAYTGAQCFYIQGTANFTLYEIGGKVLDGIFLLFPVYSVFCALLLPVLKRMYRK